MQSDFLFYGQIAAHIAFGEGNEFDLDLSLQGVSYTDYPSVTPDVINSCSSVVHSFGDFIFCLIRFFTRSEFYLVFMAKLSLENLHFSKTFEQDGFRVIVGLS